MGSTPTRRSVLQGIAATGLSGLAGCSTHEPQAGGTDSTSSDRDPRDTTERDDDLSTVTDSGQTSSPTPEDDGVPVLQTLAIEFGRWDRETDQAGDFRFEQTVLDIRDQTPVGRKAFVEFGTRVVGANGPKRLPEFAYLVPDSTAVVACHDGVVTDVSEMYSGDYAITTRESVDATWMVSHEHVDDVVVSVGDHVRAGQPIASVSTVDVDGTGYGWTELAVWKGGPTAAAIVKVCPFSALDDALKPAFAETIEGFARDWETYVGADVYDQSAWVQPGCLYTPLTEAEVFGDG